jgi:hypothetical protein
MQGVGGSGSTSYVAAADSSDFEFGTGNFTIELWMRVTTTAGIQALISKGHTGNSDLSWSLFRDAFRGTLQFLVSTNGSGDTRKEVTWAPTVNQWHHVAICRSSGALRFFVDGIKRESDIPCTENFYNGNAQVRVGWAVNFGLDGFIDEVRITKGVARYATNFTPPTAAFPNP